MSRRGNLDPVENAELECLILWPAGTVGAQEERQLIQLLNLLCQRHGYGRVPQLTAAIDEIWRDPSKGGDWAQKRENHLNFMEECRQTLKAMADDPNNIEEG